MTTVKAIVDISTKKGTIPAGHVFAVNDEALVRLAGKVKISPMTTEEAVGKISSTMEALNQSGPWPGGIWVLISPEDRERIVAANMAVDHAADVLKDHVSLDVALLQYRAAWTTALESVTGSERQRPCHRSS